MRIKGITTKVVRYRFAPFVAYVELHRDGRVVAETSTANDPESVARAELKLKCAYRHVPVPKEDDE